MLIGVVKGLHILAVIAWMAGLLYLPRLFVYHSRAAPGSEMDVTFQEMERKLLRLIMTPAMFAVIALGITLVILEGWSLFRAPWMILKLTGVAFLIFWHHLLARARVSFRDGRRDHNEKYWRMMNEVPFVVAAIIILSVTTKFTLA